MFRESDKNKQLDIFSSPSEQLRGKSKNFYNKDNSWHNLFREQITMRINETIFKNLYKSSDGAPNASVRVLVAMTILKEGQGWSDEQMFENCNYNLLIRGALGLMNLDDAPPVASTYYLFRKRLVEYNKEHKTDLMEQCMNALTKEHVLAYQVSGKQVRMDSKIIGSNIAWLSRYELVHETLRLFIDEREGFIYKRTWGKQEMALIKEILGESGSKVVYRSTKAEIDARFIALGKLMYRLVNLFANYPYGQYKTLQTVFEQQFSVDKQKVVIPLENEKISAKSVQSPHDTDAHYRDKDGNKVKGYSANITETCDDASNDEPRLNLITDVAIDVVSAADKDFLIDALNKTQEIVHQKIEKVYADGAYNSESNQQHAHQENYDLQLTAMQGAQARYDLSLDQQDQDKLTVTDIKTGNIIEAQQVKTRKNPESKQWRIITDEGKPRYFNLKHVQSSLLRQKLRDIPLDERNKRNNVEATIFQFGFHYPNNKSRYRGLDKHKLWAYARCQWINFVRILKYITQLCQRPLSLAQKTIFFNKIWFIGLIIEKIFLLKTKFINLKKYPRKYSSLSAC